MLHATYYPLPIILLFFLSKIQFVRIFSSKIIKYSKILLPTGLPY